MEEGWALSRGERRGRSGDAAAIADAAGDSDRRKDNSGASIASDGMDPPPFGVFFSADESQRESGRKALRLQQQQQQHQQVHHHQQHVQRQQQQHRQQSNSSLARVAGGMEGSGAGDVTGGGGSRGGGDGGGVGAGGGGGGGGVRGGERSARVNPWRQMKLHELMAKLEDNSVRGDAFFCGVSLRVYVRVLPM